MPSQFLQYALLATACRILAVSAHMEMQSPPPLRSRFNTKFYDFSSFDYSMTSPLALDGSNFPAKGYASDVPSKSAAVDTLTAGQEYTIKLAGDTTHRGGSCQVSFSYDGGKNFGVVHSVIGGCPLSKQITFKVPRNIPAGENVLLSWSWFNLQGNREMYQNAAAVNVKSSSSGSLKLPRIFIANVYGPDKCNTVEGDEVVFPNPGDSVEYGGIWTGKTPTKADLKLTNCEGDLLSGQESFVTLGANTGASEGGDSPSEGQGEGEKEETSGVPSSSSSVVEQVPSSISESIATPPTSTRTPPKKGSSSTAAPPQKGQPSASASSASSSSSSSARLPVPSSSSSSAATPNPITPSAPIQAGSCEEGKVVCSEDGTQFSVCGSGKLISMGNVAPGTVCTNGEIILAPTKSTSGSIEKVSCSSNALKCSDDGQSFSVCNGSGDAWINMGSVAPGTVCKDGAIGIAKNARHKRASGHTRRAMAYHRS